ncbi:hypothetical protein OEZ85_010721 [Tetradesmus obliquus]|uniref:PRISE-like Rossmann-fold domain-containing protein n=1 Tax=Tetradesmus obliquus TaxID=3088 RepID=A0ABY8TSU3_TETOB|nr:hypothetical protein OEZ85_010721 [Tetradesmus obliquus]
MHLAQLGSWKVYAVSRKEKLQYDEMPDGLGGTVTAVQVTDLLDANAVSTALSQLPDVTHIFHCAYLTSGSDQHKDAVDNLALLKHVVEAIEAAQSSDGGSGKLQHVYVQAGAKWYGQHLGKYKTPAKESDPRYMTPNFYYDMVDYAQARVAAGASWTWSALLPNPVIGYSPGSYMNLLNAIAAYAALCKEAKLPFRFPGPDAAYEALTECCDARLLAEAALFTSTSPAAANAIFNVSNGDVFRWSEVWPLICTDFCFGMGWDYFQSVTKLRRAGFEGMRLDSAEVWLGWLDELKQRRLFPL